MIVVDANVAAKWLLPEAGSDAALDLVAGPDLLFAPSIVRVEVLGAITRQAHQGRATRGESLDRCSKWLGYLDAGTITVVPEGALLQDAVKLALGIKHTFQDCLYLAAARQLDARLITADRPFYKRARTDYAKIELLAGCERN